MGHGWPSPFPPLTVKPTQGETRSLTTITAQALPFESHDQTRRESADLVISPSGAERSSCNHCGNPLLVRAGRGRTRLYHDSCRQAAYRRRKDPLVGSPDRARRKARGLFEQRQEQAVSRDLRRGDLVSDDPGARDDMPGDPLRQKPRRELGTGEFSEVAEGYAGIKIVQTDLARDLDKHLRSIYWEQPQPLGGECAKCGDPLGQWDDSLPSSVGLAEHKCNKANAHPWKRAATVSPTEFACVKCKAMVRVTRVESHVCVSANFVTPPSIGEGANLTLAELRTELKPVKDKLASIEMLMIYLSKSQPDDDRFLEEVDLLLSSMGDQLA